MIRSALTHITGHLNEFLKRGLGSSEDLVILSNLVEQDGTVAAHINNRLVVFLVNVEKDSSVQRPAREIRGASTAIVSYPPVYLNLHVMVAAHFGEGNYAEALKFLSHAVGFFQSRPVLDHSNTPDLDGRIERLVLEVENLSIQDLSNLWGVLSGHYLPSVLYKVRMVAFDSGDVSRLARTIRKPESAGAVE
jgi:hypothetical protein